MPELPEVHTTVTGLNKVLPGLKITDIWSGWFKTVKNHNNFPKFKKEIVGKNILKVERVGKNILIRLSGNKTLLVHMKMTGHFLYGNWEMRDGGWISIEDGALKDPFNRFIHHLFSLSNGKQLALSDMRKFAKILILNTDKVSIHSDLKNLGPEPLDKRFTLKTLAERLGGKPNGKIKSVLMDQHIIAGIGNIYSDEILWHSGIHPEEKVINISSEKFKKILSSTKEILKKSIAHGGDSMSDYRNIYGEKGNFQNLHKAYRQTGKKCSKQKCSGTITKIKVGGRSAHFCNKHQKLVGKK